MSTHLSSSSKAFLFFGIAFGLTLTASLLYPLLGDVTLLIHTYSPTLSVLIMMLVVTRDGYSKSGWATLGLHRLGLRYWVLALLGPLVLMSALYAIAWGSSVAQFVLPDGFTLPLLASNLSRGLAIAIILALGEEVGFRGYALPQLVHLRPNPSTAPERPDVCCLAFPLAPVDTGLSHRGQLADHWPDTPPYAHFCRRVLRLPPTRQQKHLAINPCPRGYQHLLRVARPFHRHGITVGPRVSRW